MLKIFVCKIFAALIFCSIAHQRIFLIIIVSRMEMYERAAAMPWSPTYRQSVLLGCISCTACASSLPLGPLVNWSTSRFAEAIPHEGTESDKDLLGSGSPSAGLKNHRRTVSAAQVNSVLVYTRLTVKIIRCY